MVDVWWANRDSSLGCTILPAALHYLWARGLKRMTAVEAALLRGTGLGAKARRTVEGLSACCLLGWARPLFILPFMQATSAGKSFC